MFYAKSGSNTCIVERVCPRAFLPAGHADGVLGCSLGFILVLEQVGDLLLADVTSTADILLFKGYLVFIEELASSGVAAEIL